ncbi:uncharacterized protein LOC122857680 [Aphidius gifuensis]|uniref:uncharacterized protein LOC122857680 n=1 Tax=Aphidius gifuensis TaxID=684658 RepID=UPI001CDB6E09|nr:uncharacterized protein LOC122857680 [Aphidius gifuensis]
MAVSRNAGSLKRRLSEDVDEITSCSKKTKLVEDNEKETDCDIKLVEDKNKKTDMIQCYDTMFFEDKKKKTYCDTKLFVDDRKKTDDTSFFKYCSYCGSFQTGSVRSTFCGQCRKKIENDWDLTVTIIRRKKIKLELSESEKKEVRDCLDTIKYIRGANSIPYNTIAAQFSHLIDDL